MTKMKLLTAICTIALILSAAGCGGEQETTFTGVVVSVEGSVVSLIKMDNQNGAIFSGERPTGEMGERPTGEMPERPTGEMPERPTGERPQRPNQGEGGETGERPTGEMPERPTDGETPEFKGFGGENSEAVELDLKNAHISVEIDEGKASGTMDDVTKGSFVTVTLNKKGEVTNVLVSSRSLGFGNRGFKGQSDQSDPAAQPDSDVQSDQNNA